MAGRLAPGSKLLFADLTERYGVSMGALREGLQRLAEQGLVESEPQIGFRVMSLSTQDLEDLTTARCEIEGMALRYAITHGDLAWESAIVASLHTLERTPVDGAEGDLISDDWTAAHTQFHEALIAACPNTRIRNMASTLRASAEVYRHWSKIGDERGGYPRDITAEHHELVEAVLGRDTEQAVRLLEQHLWATARLLINRASNLGPQAGD